MDFEVRGGDKTNKIILDLCGGTGSWSKPYEDAGYNVKLITLPKWDVTDVMFLEETMVFKRQTKSYYDWLSIPYEDVYGILAAPPCTEFSVLNAIAAPRERKPEEGMVIVDACLKIINHCNPKFWALENPSGYLRQYIGQPAFTFQPWQFGDAWTKKTDIWGVFNKPQILFKDWNDVPKLPIYTRPNRGKPSLAYLHKSAQALIPQLQGFKVDSDAAFRAITPPGFAKAFFKSNQ